MTTTFTFPSVRNSNMRYRIYEGTDANPSYSWRDSSYKISGFLESYDTMGDGEVQHSAGVCPSQCETADFLRSLVCALDRINGFPGWLVAMWRYNEPSVEVIQFVGKLKYREDKNTYFNLSELKQSTAESRQHDKRWDKLDRKWEDETNLQYRLRLLYSDTASHQPFNWLGHIGTAKRVSDVLEESWNLSGYLSEFDAFKGMERDDIRRALSDFNVINSFVEGSRLVSWAQGVSERLKINLAEGVA